MRAQVALAQKVEDATTKVVLLVKKSNVPDLDKTLPHADLKQITGGPERRLAGGQLRFWSLLFCFICSCYFW